MLSVMSHEASFLSSSNYTPDRSIRPHTMDIIMAASCLQCVLCIWCSALSPPPLHSIDRKTNIFAPTCKYFCGMISACRGLWPGVTWRLVVTLVLPLLLLPLPLVWRAPGQLKPESFRKLVDSSNLGCCRVVRGPVSVRAAADGGLLAGRAPPHPRHRAAPRGLVPHPRHHDHRAGACHVM